MAKKSPREELFETLRARGLRTRAARVLSDAASTGRGGADRGTKAARGVIADLRKVADDLENRITGASSSSSKSKSRSEAGKKAARTRARNADKRSASAKKAAQTRKTKSSGSTRKPTRAKARSKS